MYVAKSYLYYLCRMIKIKNLMLLVLLGSVHSTLSHYFISQLLF